MPLTPAQIEARRVHLRDQELACPSALYWLSFADPDLPKGSQFLGVTIVEAHGIVTATERAFELDCNPGGEVACYALPERARDRIPVSSLNRLLSAEEAKVIGGG